MILTIFTIGYGNDFSPQTNGGRIISLLSTLNGAFILSWVLVIVTNWVFLSPNEEKALKDILKYRKKKKYVKVIALSTLSAKCNDGDVSSFDDKGKDIQYRLERRCMNLEERIDYFIERNLK